MAEESRRDNIIQVFGRLLLKYLKPLYLLISQDSVLNNQHLSQTSLLKVILHLGSLAERIIMFYVSCLLPFYMPSQSGYLPQFEMRDVDLPMDIIIEILSRLPVKSLMRFKCISKSFCSLICNDPYLKMNHLNHAYRRMATLWFDFKTKTLYSCSISNLLPNESFRQDVVKLDVPDKLEGLCDIYRSCNGLFCVRNIGGSVFLWNPLTQELKKLPDCPTDVDVSTEPVFFKTVAYGLAYDPVSDDYTVLKMVCFNDIQNNFGSELYLCSVKTSWRRIEGFPCVDFDWSALNFFNGAFHWIARKVSGRGPRVLVSLNLTTEKYSVFALPQQSTHWRSPSLAVLNGNLALGFFCHGNYTVLVMEEYGNIESLAKIVSIRSDKVNCDSSCNPLYLFGDGRIMFLRSFMTRKRVDIYMDGELVSVDADASWNKMFDIGYHTYTDTLVSADIGLES
ncbi:unnamed protein product [Cuscuta epithymum]|uniref:F-box domain-containing protein n=1 Tax=Cuscuta epithymum TaxID=186058 RepID=A0AAV0F6C8_9ASTE|nr:unnamed protein product [Cuscuta epithymum]